MRPAHKAMIRALQASAIAHSSPIASPTAAGLLTARGSETALASPVSAAAVASAPPAIQARPKNYPLDGFNFLTVLPQNAPVKSEQAQFGTNACAQYGASNQGSLCQNAYLNSADDFCLWGPPFSNGINGSIALTERFEVAWCTKPGYGTRLIPDNTLTSVHFVQTPLYVQVTGTGNFQNIGLPAGDQGGELDPHGDDSTGNPQGGLVWSTAFANASGVMTQSHEWTMFIGATQFCFRVCQDGPLAAAECNHIYDTLGCEWNMPSAPLNPGVFESCKGDAANPPMGVYVTNGVTSTFTNGAAITPSAHAAPPSSLCVTQASIPTNGATVDKAYASLISGGSVAAAAPTITSAAGSGAALLPQVAVVTPAAQSNVVAAVSVPATPSSTHKSGGRVFKRPWLGIVACAIPLLAIFA